MSDVADAKGIAPLIGCKPRYIVDEVSKRPGFPTPVKFRPLMWPIAKVIEWRDNLSPVSQPIRRRSRRNTAKATRGSDAR